MLNMFTDPQAWVAAKSYSDAYGMQNAQSVQSVIPQPAAQPRRVTFREMDDGSLRIYMYLGTFRVPDNVRRLSLGRGGRQHCGQDEYLEKWCKFQALQYPQKDHSI
jgi:hypothetical protein